MDSDHSSASHLDLLESDLDRAGTDLDFASAPAVDDPAAPPSAMPSGFRLCACGRRMSSKTHDHHAFCVTCRGYHCDFNNRRDECQSLTDNDFQTYLRHQKSLKRKSLSKQRARARVADAASVVNPAHSPLVSPSVSIASKGVGHDIEVKDHPIINQPQTGVSLDQIKDLLRSFFCTLEEKFAQMSSRIDNLSQDVIKSNNDSFSAHTAVAGRAEPTPKVPHCSYTDGRGSTLGEPAAAVAPAGADSRAHISFESLLSRVRELEVHFGYLPDRYLQSMVGQIIMSSYSLVMMSGESIVDSVRSYRLRVCDPVSPTPASSCDGDSLVPFLRSLFGLPAVVLSSGTVPSAVASSGSGATVMGRDSSVVLGWGVPSVAPSVSTSVASGVAVSHLGGRPVLCLFYLFRGHLCGLFYCLLVCRFGFWGVCSTVAGVPGDFGRSFSACFSSFFHGFSSCSFSSLYSSFGSCFFGYSCLFSTFGSCWFCLLGVRREGAWFQGRWGWRLLMHLLGVVCLSLIRLGYMWTL